jgi:hypothetical protein
MTFNSKIKLSQGVFTNEESKQESLFTGIISATENTNTANRISLDQMREGECMEDISSKMSSPLKFEDDRERIAYLR